ncbi:MAG: hypothetical protein JNK57_00255 [Planctomycetaceae bacterium]|nr:hypothetical protein [Planctomycetaceae bacterium]
MSNRNKQARNLPKGILSSLLLHRTLPLGCVVGALTVTGGCFSSWVSPTSHIAPPATKIAPTSMAESDLPPTSLPKDASTTPPPRATLLTPPLPSDLPQIPISRE